jgi:hypothetical protein
MLNSLCALLICFSFAIPARFGHEATIQASSQKDGSGIASKNTQAASVAPLSSGFLADGTPVQLRLNRNLSSATERKGNAVDFLVLEDVKVGGITVIPRGSTAWGVIAEAEPKRWGGRGGKLNVQINNLELKGGGKVSLRAVKENKGSGGVAGMATRMVVFNLVAPLFLFSRGKDVNIPKGTAVTAYVAENVALDSSTFSANTQTEAAAAPKPADAKVSINSTPSEAEVELDGKFIGSTPSSINVAGGEHSVRINKKGYKSWERQIAISGVDINLNALLEQER